MDKPLVSVLMTACNREKYIAEAIESVLASTYQNWELIIVDDGSKDRTVEIAKTYEAKDKRIKVYINEKNLGDYPNRNKAASYANGKYIKYLDSDDIIYPCSLQIMVEAMEDFSDAGIGLSYNSYNNETRLPLKLTQSETIETHFFRKALLSIGPSGSIFNREFFNILGGFKDFGVASDYEFNIRAACAKPTVLFQRDLIWWRIHSEQEFRLKEREYLKQNHKIHKSMLKNIEFPIIEINKKEININYKKNNARKFLLNIAKFRFSNALDIINNTKPGFEGFIFAMMPSRIRKIFIR